MNENLFTGIENCYEELSKTNKKLADYVRANSDRVAFFSIKELEEKTGVSTASISRFAKAIGFSGYNAFQKALADEVLKNVTPMKEFKYSVEEGGVNTTLQAITNANAASLHALYTDQLQKEFDCALEQLQQVSGDIYITASRTSFSVAYYLHFMLSGFLPNVHLISDSLGSLSLQVSHVTAEDCLIAISYSKYTKFTFDITSYFAAKGCNVTAITDSYTSPIATKANQVLVGKNMEGAFSFVAAMTLANALVSAIGKLHRQDTLLNMKQQEEVADRFDVYL